MLCAVLIIHMRLDIAFGNNTYALFCGLGRQKINNSVENVVTSVKIFTDEPNI